MKKLFKYSILFYSLCASFCLSASPCFHAGSLVVLPQDGRQVYLEAFAKAKKEIRIEICVLEDPIILGGLQEALMRGVCVRVIVDKLKYDTTFSEQINLEQYLTSNGGELHLSNPIFPRSFPKVVLIDDVSVLIGSACLDSLTFAQYRDYIYVSFSPNNVKELSSLFENDWMYSAEPLQSFPSFNPTPPLTVCNLMVSPVNSSNKLVDLYRQAELTLDVTSELLGNSTLESELYAAVSRGVCVRLIAPEIVNGASVDEQLLQIASLNKLKAAGVHVHVTRPPETMQTPYMHARTAIVDNKYAYLGSVSLSPDSITFNREVGLILKKKHVIKKMKKQFTQDFTMKSVEY